MKVLLLNQTFHPDVVSTAQHLTDFALELSQRGHQVTVVASRRAYDDPNQRFAKHEIWSPVVSSPVVSVEIQRIWSTGFGKGAKWRRGLDFASFMLACCWRLLWLPRFDVVVALTSPPLISFIGACFAKWKRGKFLYWVMDLNPDEAVAAGWLRKDAPVTRLLDALSRFSLKRADKVIALDRFMSAHIAGKGTAEDRIAVIPPWSHNDAVRFDAAGREKFRRAHGLDGKFVVMYSGNHSPCHPLDTLLQAASRLVDRQDIVFCFVGGGSEFRKIQQMVRGPWSVVSGPVVRGPVVSGPNILCLPYQPLNELAGSLSAADLHVVVMGDPFVGTIHPCKIYNILTVASPVLYIGPRPSHVSEIFDVLGNPSLCRWAAHGEVDAVVQQISKMAQCASRLDGKCAARAACFSKETLLPRLVSELESLRDARCKA